ncbi:MAG: serine protease [Cohaesibacter sp.]|nr:serine protease [Cohaesibacter sp.]
MHKVLLLFLLSSFLVGFAAPSMALEERYRCPANQDTQSHILQNNRFVAPIWNVQSAQSLEPGRLQLQDIPFSTDLIDQAVSEFQNNLSNQQRPTPQFMPNIQNRELGNTNSNPSAFSRGVPIETFEGNGLIPTNRSENDLISRPADISQWDKKKAIEAYEKYQAGKKPVSHHDILNGTISADQFHKFIRDSNETEKKDLYEAMKKKHGANYSVMANVDAVMQRDEQALRAFGQSSSLVFKERYGFQTFKNLSLIERYRNSQDPNIRALITKLKNGLKADGMSASQFTIQRVVENPSTIGTPKPEFGNDGQPTPICINTGSAEVPAKADPKDVYVFPKLTAPWFNRQIGIFPGVGLIVDADDIVCDNATNMCELLKTSTDGKFAFPKPSDNEYPVCFSQDPNGAFKPLPQHMEGQARYKGTSCTGFLAGDKSTVITAYHCMVENKFVQQIYDERDIDCLSDNPIALEKLKQTADVLLKQKKIIFGFRTQMSPQAPIQFSADHVFDFKAEKEGSYLNRGEQADVIVLELSEAVDAKIASPFQIDSEPLRETDKDQGKLFVKVGHPLGYPMSWEYNKVFINAIPDLSIGKFRISSDSFHGSSGSPVFDLKTGKVVSIMVCGDQDFEALSSNAVQPECIREGKTLLPQQSKERAQHLAGFLNN